MVAVAGGLAGLVPGLVVAARAIRHAVAARTLGREDKALSGHHRRRVLGLIMKAPVLGTAALDTV